MFGQRKRPLRSGEIDEVAMPNRLAHAASPYLRQHADNPVDWYEWGEEAFARAREQNKPLFVSVGYSSCHWCHVMAHESFSDAAVAALLNSRFVPVKVDREERPDVDSVYMDAVQALTGQGGWPMSVFALPDGTPFFGGTYWPRDDRLGMPGFLRVLEGVARAWESQRDQVASSGQRLVAHLRGSGASANRPGDVDRVGPELAAQAAQRCVAAWDRAHGGFGGAPKFPQAMTIDFLLAHALRTGSQEAQAAAAHSLERMSRGGIYDQVGGGFARYSTDAVWLVPHFEKMLYDNALLLRAYTHAWQVTADPRMRRVAIETADYLLRDMQAPHGGLYAATDADSEGVEGRFFVWPAREFDDVVAGAGEDVAEWRHALGVTDGGNFEGANILTDPHPWDETDSTLLARRNRVRAALFAQRELRVHPGLDDKIITSWNALALGALAEAGAALGFERYLTAAQSCAAFLADALCPDGVLHHTFSEGHGVGAPAFCEDVAYLAQALLVLYEADHDPAWVDWASALVVQARESFADGDTGGYFDTAAGTDTLITRPMQVWDNATPAASSVLADVHLRLYGLTGDAVHAEAAHRTLARFAGHALAAPTGFGELLRAVERLLAGPREVAVVGDPADPSTAALVEVYREAWRPGSVLAVGLDARVPLLRDRPLVDGLPAAYVCRDFACQRPVTDPGDLRALLAG